jgi:hypothetical protein
VFFQFVFGRMLHNRVSITSAFSAIPGFHHMLSQTWRRPLPVLRRKRTISAGISGFMRLIDRLRLRDSARSLFQALQEGR